MALDLTGDVSTDVVAVGLKGSQRFEFCFEAVISAFRFSIIEVNAASSGRWRVPRSDLRGLSGCSASGLRASRTRWRVIVDTLPLNGDVLLSLLYFI